MVRASFLVPTRSNEGTPFSVFDFLWVTDELIRRFDGFTRDGTVQGEW